MTISGAPGTGNTTVSRIVAERLRYRLVTMGEMNKEIARDAGYTMEGFWKKLEKDPDELARFHKALDQRQKDIASKETDVIFNGKLSAFQIPQARVRVLIRASLKTRAERTVKRDGGDVQEAERSIKSREESERKDWKKVYGFDYTADTEAYNLILDTDNMTAEQAADKVIEMIRREEHDGKRKSMRGNKRK